MQDFHGNKSYFDVKGEVQSRVNFFSPDAEVMTEIEEYAVRMELIHASAASMRKALRAESSFVTSGKCNFT